MFGARHAYFHTIRCRHRCGGSRSAAALAGAGVAAAADPGPANFDSDSTLGVAWVDGEIQVTYDNRSGRQLACIVTIGDADLIELFEAYVKSASGMVLGVQALDHSVYYAALEGAPWTAELADSFADAAGANAGFPVAEGASGAVPLDYSWDPTWSTGSTLTDTDVELAAVSICSTSNQQYIEVESAYGAGGTGSLENVFGSATGSLGSLGS